MFPDIDLSIIIVNYNTKHLLEELFASINSALGSLKAQIILIDNASTDGSVEYIERKYQHLIFIKNEKNVGFGRANNQALKLIEGEYVLLLNTDAFVSPDSLKLTIDYMNKTPSCGVLGVKLVGRDGGSNLRVGISRQL